MPGTRYENYLGGVIESVAVSQKNGTWEKADAQGCTRNVLQSDTRQYSHCIARDLTAET